MADSPGDAPHVGAEPFVGVVCPLLVILETPEDGSPVDHRRPDDANRCAAADPPTPLSLVQQRLVCLEAGHLDCPRFVRALGSGRGGSARLTRQASMRGGAAIGAGSSSASASGAGDHQPAARSETEPGEAAAAAATAPAEALAQAPVVPDASVLPAVAAVSQAPAVPAVPEPPVPLVAPVVRSTRRSGARPARSRPGPIVLAVGILAVALVVAFVFTSLRGGLSLPGAAPSLGTEGPSSSPSQLLSPSPTAVPSPTPTLEPSPAATPSPIPTPSPTSSPSAAPTPSGSPLPSVPPAFVGLKPCPDAPSCYLYRVRSGDNLTRIAQRFGVTASAIRKLNPDITDPSLIHVGDTIRIPLPTS